MSVCWAEFNDAVATLQKGATNRYLDWSTAIFYTSNLPLVGFQHLRHDRCMGAVAGRSTGRDDEIGLHPHQATCQNQLWPLVTLRQPLSISSKLDN